VINEEMLRKAVEEQGPQGRAGRIAKEGGIQYDEVIQLRLEYKILQIDHLWEFTSLTKLQLNNNSIEKIQGLEKLTNLLWLLSFNKIKMIEGLEALVKLQTLSLSNNQIPAIEKMDTLEHLEILSLGENVISQIDNVIYLRRFKNLRSLNLARNPICQETNYKIFVVAYLPDLVYLDFRLVDEQTNELKEKRAMEAQKITEQELQLHKDAFVEYLNGPQLFDSMFADDAEESRLASLPGVPKLLETYPCLLIHYQTELVALCMQIFETGLIQHAERKNEGDSFFTCCREAVSDNQQRAAQIVTDFEESRRQVMAEMQKITDPELLEAQRDNYSEKISQLSDTLMTLELQLVDQLEDVFKEFERNISDMVGAFIENVQGIYPLTALPVQSHFAQCRELEKHYHEKLQEIALATLEKMARNELEEDMPEDMHLLLVDKDTVVKAVSASHDTHQLKIDNREDELMTRINSWMSAMMKSVQDEEVTRNRKRISEIRNYLEYVRNQLDEIILP
uniref:Dynein regulatory complex subunit 3 n=1 Tax=Astyanax mexicanus TaxID=7994 RepID=A0A3B1JE72_ASTMX